MSYTNGLDDPSAHFQIATYTGNGTDNTAITYDGNSDMQPDFLWFKLRSTTGNHVLFDSNRGVTKYIRSNTTAAETTNGTLLKSFDTDGFTVGSNASTNYNNQTLVSWGWKANGGTTSSNTDGTITTTVQANTTAGFSIATWTGNGTNGATIGHGNSGIPNGYIVKRLDTTADWGVGGGYTGNVWVGGTSAVMHLNTDDAVSEAYNNYWGSSFPNNQVLPLSQNAEINASGGSYVGYFFRSIQGYSKLGRYTGNGNDDGAFVYTGFKPAFVLYKKTSSENWIILDNKRDPHNVAFTRLVPNKTNADTTSLTSLMDFTSNGFKLRTSHATINSNNTDYIYMAFAENPFVTSTDIPTTAR